MCVYLILQLPITIVICVEYEQLRRSEKVVHYGNLLIVLEELEASTVIGERCCLFCFVVCPIKT